jgi:hypothetical protein
LRLRDGQPRVANQETNSKISHICPIAGFIPPAECAHPRADLEVSAEKVNDIAGGANHLSTKSSGKNHLPLRIIVSSTAFVFLPARNLLKIAEGGQRIERRPEIHSGR